MTSNNQWPELAYADWKDTCEALHLWTQIVGKYRLAHTPWINHSWHATLYVTPRGLTTGPIPDGQRTTSVTLDLLDHQFIAEGDDGKAAGFDLGAMSVADFFARACSAIESIGGDFSVHGRPNEIADAIPFAEDRSARPYDAHAVERYHQALLRMVPLFEAFRTGFLGKSSPTHLFWGSFDLALTRFSGRKAPLHPAGIPNLPDEVAQEAYSHEVSSAGFWPGNGGAGEAMFYAYAYPAPEGYSSQSIAPEAARWDDTLGEFLLPYEAVRSAKDPEATLMAFLQSTYDAAADTGDWDRDALECGVQQPRRPRPLNN